LAFTEPRTLKPGDNLARRHRVAVADGVRSLSEAASLLT
jgi:hypothetical protein